MTNVFVSLRNTHLAKEGKLDFDQKELLKFVLDSCKFLVIYSHNETAYVSQSLNLFQNSVKAYISQFPVVEHEAFTS